MADSEGVATWSAFTILAICWISTDELSRAVTRVGRIKLIKCEFNLFSMSDLHYEGRFCIGMGASGETGWDHAGIVSFEGEAASGGKFEIKRLIRWLLRLRRDRRDIQRISFGDRQKDWKSLSGRGWGRLRLLKCTRRIRMIAINRGASTSYVWDDGERTANELQDRMYPRG